MRKIEQAPEPEGFDEKVRQPGMEFLATHPKGTKPKDYWKECKDDLYDAYAGYCAYTTFRITPRSDAVVDHFLPKAGKEGRGQIYEWSNYRLSSFYVNCVKNEGVGIIDPVDLPANAFVLDDSMRLHVNHGAFDSEEDAQKAEFTLARLGLNSQAYIRDRRDNINELLHLDDPREGCDCLRIPAMPSREGAFALRRQSLFLYEEAVRLGYCEPVHQGADAQAQNKNPG